MSNKIKCKECNVFEYEPHKTGALGWHIKKYHKDMRYDDYIVKYEYNNIWPCCVTCKNKLQRRKTGFGKYCSKKCSSNGEHNPMYGKKGKLSPIYGTKRSEEQLLNYSIGAHKRWELHGDELRNMMNSDEYREAQRLANIKKYKNDPDLKNRIADSVHKFWELHPDADMLRQRATDRAIDMSNNGIIGPQAPFKAKWVYNPFTQQNEYMHSSWETFFLNNCILKSLPVTKKHELRIPYFDKKGCNKTYIPDFIAIDKNIIYEIKGYYRKYDFTKIIELKKFGVKNNFEIVILDNLEDIENYFINKH